MPDAVIPSALDVATVRQFLEFAVGSSALSFLIGICAGAVSSMFGGRSRRRKQS